MVCRTSVFSRYVLVVLQKYRKKYSNQLQYHSIIENLRVWKWHMAIAYDFFFQYWHFIKFINLSIYELPTQQQKQDLKHYEHDVSCHLFPAHLAPSQGPSKFKTEDQNTEPFHVFMTFLITLSTPSMHIEMVTYCVLRRVSAI